MKAKQRVIIFAYWFGTGLMTPVLTLMLLERGCTLQTAPLVLAAYGAVALLLELPSGIYADRRGRKRTFLTAILIYAGAFALMLMAHSFMGLAAAMMLYGAARAFASGSLDALVIDDFLERNGEEHMHEITSQMSVTIGCGIASGAVTGGILPGMAGYSVHLILRLLLLGVIGIMTVRWIAADTPVGSKSGGEAQNPFANLTGISMTPPLLRLLLSIGCLTIIVAAVETYWTPALKALTPGSNVMLGVLSASSFFLLTLGSMAMGRLRVKTIFGRWNLYFALQVMLGAAALILSLQRSALGFAAAYLFFYLLMGMDDVQEQTLLNTLADSGNRAATLSAGSLVGQLGGMVSAGFCSITVLGLGFGGVWKAIGLFSVSVFAVLWLLTMRSRKNL